MNYRVTFSPEVPAKARKNAAPSPTEGKGAHAETKIVAQASSEEVALAIDVLEESSSSDEEDDANTSVSDKSKKKAER